jgi:hypothetical protein
MHKTEDIERHLFGRERANTVAFEFMSDNVRNQVLNLPNDCTTGSQTEVFTPAFRGPSLEKSLKECLGLYDLSWSSDKMTTCFLVLDSPQNSQ